MTPEEFTKTQTVNVIYDPNGRHILEKHVYELMQDYTEQQLAIQLVSQQRELLKSCFLALDEVSRDNAIITDEDAFIDEVIKDFNCG
jgi:hypothetical protein